MAYTLPPTPAEVKRSDEIPYKEIVRYRAELVRIMTENYTKQMMLAKATISKIISDATELTEAAYGKEIEKS